MKQTTHDTLISKQQSYQRTADRLQENLFLRKEAALTDAELAAFKEAVAATNFVQNIYGGNVDEAVADITDQIDLEDGEGRFNKEFRPGIGSYGGESTSIEFTVKESAVEPAEIRAWNYYDTEELAQTVMGATVPNENVEALNDELEALKEGEGSSLEDALSLLAAHNLIADTDYLGSGYMGPYAGSNNFAASDGFEWINLTEGCIVRFGHGSATMDTERWEFFSGELDSFLMAIDPDSHEEEGNILMGGNSSGNGTSDKAKAADEITMLVQLAQVIADPDNVPSDYFTDDIANRDRKYREEQGQQNLFPEPQA